VEQPRLAPGSSVPSGGSVLHSAGRAPAERYAGCRVLRAGHSGARPPFARVRMGAVIRASARSIYGRKNFLCLVVRERKGAEQFVLCGAAFGELRIRRERQQRVRVQA
jgi:hypothetical protein